AERLGPAPVVADQHAGDGVHETPDAKAEIPDLEVFLLQVLERGLGLMVRMPRQVHLAVLADEAAVGTDEDRAVEPPLLGRELRVADVEADAELLRLIEKRRRLLRWNLLFKEFFGDLLLILDPPAWKEGGEGELWEDDELRAHAVGFPQQVRQSPDGDGSGILAVQRPELGRGDLEVSSHG